MNPLKVGLAIALSTVGVGSGVAFGVANLAPVNEVQVAEATVTDGLYRMNVLTNSANWLQDNVKTLTDPGAGNVEFNKDSDFANSTTNTNYNSVTIGSTSYNFATYTSNTINTFYNNDVWFGRGSLSNNYNWFDAGNINLNNVMKNNKYDNTFVISGSWNNFSVQSFGWYIKVAVHTGLNLENIEYILMNSSSVPSTPADIGNKKFAGWYKDANFTQKWTSGSQYTDINLYAKYDVEQYYLVGDSAFVNEIGSSGSTWDHSGGYLMSNVSGSNKAEAVLTFATTVQLKSIYYFNGNTTWLDVGGSTGTGISVVSGNYQLAAGTYSFYISSGDNKLYIAVGLQLDAFCTDFLTKTGNVCNGEDTIESDLLSVWTYLATEYAKMSGEDQATLADTQADESGNDAEKVMARYDVIIKNHSSFNDFMNRKSSANYSFKSNNVMNVVRDNSALIIIVTFSMATSIVGAFFIFKKRKHQ